ncbi:MAG: extracellular solute-binding protein [Acetobacteraceae bacterium]|nr:extracellular solute-binding protein [Acetobacteraceae bacterium]
MPQLHPVSRRNALKLGASAAVLPLVHIRTAGAAGKLAVGVVDHWVPRANEMIKQQIDTWAEKNKVQAQVDRITTVGAKLQLTGTAESQAATGHDMMTFIAWDPQSHASKLAPMDDVMKRLVAKYGEMNEVCQYLGRAEGQWVVIPSSVSTQYKGPCARISMLKQYAGIDPVEMYPVRPERTQAAENWTYETHLKAAEACHKAGHTFGIGLGTTPDSVDTAGAIFRAYGAELVNAKGEVTVDSDAVRECLEHAQQLVKWLPADATSYDDASNNRELIGGKSALIWNPPSAWAVAKRDAIDVASDCWTFPAPRGPKGSYTPFLPFHWGVWKFSKNQTAGKELVEWLMQREQVEQRCNTCEGYDIPPFPSMADFKVWEEVEPPKGTVYNYILRPHHHSSPHIAAFPAPPDIGVQIYNRGTPATMFSKLQSGQSVNEVIAWANAELEGFVR